MTIDGLSPDDISIHALREEGDARTTTHHRKQRFISIHALREEGDTGLYGLMSAAEISIHALREEGDSGSLLSGKTKSLFLSTPSARRATAKTEKNISAFVSL